MSETPILDLEQEPPKPRRPWVAWFVGGPITLAFLYAPGISGAISPHAPAFNLWLWLPALYVAVTIHELGHCVAAKLAGMDSGGLILGGFSLIKSGQRWVFRFDGRFLFGGGFIPLPAKGASDRTHFAWMVAGGPIATLLYLGLCGLAVARLGNGTWNWIGAAFWGATLPLSSLLPYTSGGLTSDAANLWRLLRNPEQSRRWIALVALQTEDANGVLPRDWDSELIEIALHATDAEVEYPWIKLLAYYRSADQRDQETAARHLEGVLASASRNGGKALCRVCFLGAVGPSARRKGAAHARVWLDRAIKIDKGQKIESTDAAEAAIAMAEQRYDDALRHWAAARDFLARKRLDSGIARSAKQRYAEAESECHAALAELAAALPVHQAGSPATKEPAPFPWIGIAAIAIVGMILLIALAVRYFPSQN
jgi:hypothetical protein